MNSFPLTIGGHPGVVTAVVPANAAADAVEVGRKYGSVTLAPLGTGTWQINAAGAVYGAGVTYAANDVVVASGAAYRSLQAGNIGHTPATSPTWWAVFADDWPRMIAWWTACQAGGYRPYLGPGLWVCATANLEMPNNSCLFAYPGFALLIALAATAIPDNCAFFHHYASGAQVLLSADTAPGTKTCTVAALPTGGLVAGERIIIGLDAHWYPYTVVTVAGGGPYTITADRNFRRVFRSGVEYLQKQASISQNIHVDLGNGLVMGECSRVFEAFFAQDCTWKNTRVNCDNITDFVGSFDTAGLRNRFENITIEGKGKPTIGLAFESNEDSLAIGCNVTDAATCGIGMLASDSCYAIACNVHGSPNGSYQGQFPLADNLGFGCQDCAYLGGDYTGNTANGIALNPYTRRAHILGADVSDSPIGVYIDTPVTDSEIHQLTANRCRTNGAIYFGAPGASDLRVFGMTAWDCAPQTVYMNTSSSLDICGFKFGDTMGDAWRGFKGTADFTLIRLRQGSWDVSGAAAGGATLAMTELYGGLLDIADVVQVGTKPGGGGSVYCMYQGAAGALARVGGGMRMVAACTLNGGTAAAYNIGTFTLNGVTEVDVAANILIGDTIRISLATVGTTPGNAMPYFSKAQAAGHFYVKSPTASANDVYNWQAY